MLKPVAEIRVAQQKRGGSMMCREVTWKLDIFSLYFDSFYHPLL